MIINLTQHPATSEQLAVGVIELPEDEQAAVNSLLEFTGLPTADDLDDRAESLAMLAGMSGLLEDGAPFGALIMIDGPAFFMSTLERTLIQHGFRPCHAVAGGFFEVEEKPDFHPIPVREWAQAYFGTLAAFARAQGVSPQQVTNWIGGGYSVDRCQLYTGSGMKSRDLKPPR